METQKRTLASAAAVGLILLVSCAPRPSPALSGAGGAAESAKSPKTLTIATQSELQGFILELTQDNSGVGGVKQPKSIVHSLLAAENDKGAWIPELAEAQISIDRGTWQLNADGSMHTTWRIRPGVKWHDGTPFTSDDLLFSFEVFCDPEVTTRVGTPARLMTGASAPDAHTLVVRWSSPYVEADQAPGLAPLPRHLLEETYRTSKPGFGNSPRLSAEFVGLGPYRLVNWERGSHLENRVTRPGAGIYAIGEARYHVVPHTKFVGSPQNRWSGSNYGGYSSPQVDGLIDRLEITIAPAERVTLIRDMLRLVMGDVVVFPMYWDLTNVLALKGVNGIPGGEGGYHTWNFFEWDTE